MKRFIDGDQMCFTHDDFANLQESPAVFVPVSDPDVQLIIRENSLYAASGEFLMGILQRLDEYLTPQEYAEWQETMAAFANDQPPASGKVGE